MSNEKLVLLLNFRMSDRIPTEQGIRLDRVTGLDSSAQLNLRQAVAGAAINATALDTMQPSPARFTAIMRSQFSAVFDAIYRLSLLPTSPSLGLNIEGMNRVLAVDDVFAMFSSSDKAAGVEGDDLVFCIVLAGDVEGPAAIVLDRRPASYAAAASLLRSLAPGLAGTELDHAGFVGIPGFYLIGNDDPASSDQAPGSAGRAWLQTKDGNPALACVSCYLFYCWLMCQRAERLLNSISFEGDRDVETRKFILTRKKIVASMRFALLKNRAEPDSPVLPVFFRLLQKFRLEEQLNNLAFLSEEAQKAVSTQENYLASNRLRKIELILFVSTILGLGVGLNAIQMPPFYDSATANILHNSHFWIVFAIVFGGAVLIWGSLENWGRTRRMARRVIAKLTRGETK